MINIVYLLGGFVCGATFVWLVVAGTLRARIQDYNKQLDQMDKDREQYIKAMRSLPVDGQAHWRIP